MKRFIVSFILSFCVFIPTSPSVSHLVEGKLAASTQLKGKEKGSWFRQQFGDIEIAPTLELVIRSLGGFQQGEQIIPLELPDPMEGEVTGYIPFHLNEEGRMVFEELLMHEEGTLSEEAFLLTYKSDALTHQKLLGGLWVLPYGILVRSKETKEYYFLNFAQLFIDPQVFVNPAPSQFQLLQADLAKLFYSLYIEYAKLLLPQSQRIDRRMGYLELSEVSGKSFLSEDPKYKLNLLTISNSEIPGRNHLPSLFASGFDSSLEFQEAFLAMENEIKGRRVQELGVGSGVNALNAWRFGASSFVGTDIFQTYVLLSRWNLQYAQDTKQIPKVPEGKIKFIRKWGFAESNAEIYISNLPAVYPDERFSLFKDESPNLQNRALYISETHFAILFKELKERLLEPGTKALWRVMISDLTKLVEIPAGGLEVVIEGPSGRKINPMRQIAELFLDASDLHYKRVIHPKSRFYSYFYMLRKPQTNLRSSLDKGTALSEMAI